MILKLILWASGALSLLLAGGATARFEAQRRVAATLAIRTPNGIEEAGFVRIGGVDQWIQIRGNDRANPVVLVLHGGPGMSYVPLTPFFREWEQRFTVVQWDRRGVGKTFGRNGESPTPLSFDLLAKDGIEVTEHLRKRLGTERIILIGHSMGSAIGVLMVKARPDLFHAYVGTDQVVDMKTNEAVSYRMLRERAKRWPDERIRKSVAALEAPPYTNADRWFEKQRLISATDPYAASFENSLFKTVMTAPNYSMGDMIAFGKGLKYSAAALLSDMMTLDLRSLGTDFDVPMFLFEGENDVLDPTQLAVDYFASITAPTKQVVMFAGAGHNAMLMRNVEFAQKLVEHVLPFNVRDK